MTGLAGYIFQDFDEKSLDRNEVLHRLMYLDEKIEQGLPMQKELEYQAIKLRLLKRLRELIREQITSIEKHKSGGAL
jgi:hypothetical protein